MRDKKIFFINDEARKKYERQQQNAIEKKKEQNQLLNKEIDLGLIYKLDKSLYWRITSSLESNEINDVYYFDVGMFTYFYFKHNKDVLDIIRISSGDTMNDPSLKHVILDTEEFKILKKIGHSKQNHDSTAFSPLVRKINNLEFGNYTHVITNKYYDISYFQPGDTEENIMTIQGNRVDSEIKKLQSKGFIVSMTDNRQYLFDDNKENMVSMDAILNAMDFLPLEKLKIIQMQCEALRDEEVE